MNKLIGFFAIIASTFIFAINAGITKSVINSTTVSPFALTFFRFAGGGLLFWISSLFVKDQKPTKKEIGTLFLAMFLGIGLNQTFFYWGLSLSSTIDALIIITSSPIITMLLSAYFLKEPISLKKTIGVILGAAGAIWIIVNSNSAVGQSEIVRSPWGIVLCFLSSVSFSFYVTYFKPIVTKYHPITVSKWMFLFATIVFMPIFWGDVSKIDFYTLTQTDILNILYIIVMGTFAGYLLIPIAQKRLRPTTLMSFNNFQPIIGSLFAVYVLGVDTFSWQKLVSIALVLSGVYFVVISKAKNKSNV